MKIELDKKGLICLLKGITPIYDIMNNDLIKRMGYYIGGFNDRWDWNNLDKFTENELYTAYLICRKANDNFEKELKHR